MCIFLRAVCGEFPLCVRTQWKRTVLGWNNSRQIKGRWDSYICINCLGLNSRGFFASQGWNWYDDSLSCKTHACSHFKSAQGQQRKKTRGRRKPVVKGSTGRCDALTSVFAAVLLQPRPAVRSPFSLAADGWGSLKKKKKILPSANKQAERLADNPLALPAECLSRSSIRSFYNLGKPHGGHRCMLTSSDTLKH